jgi:cytoskeleton protein RodZ
MASEPGGEQVRDIGARLRAAREGKGITVLQAAEKLHVDARILEALEVDNFALLGADVYVRGHLRRYAELVGESPGQLQDLYAGGRQAPVPDLTRIPHPARAGAAHRVAPTLLGLAALVIALLSWWFMRTPGEKPQPLAAAPAAAPAPPAALAASEPSTPAAAAGQMQLTLRFSGLSWVEVSDTTGRRLLQGLYADSARTLSGSPPLRVVLGNAPAVALQLNGQPVPLAGLARRDGSARVLIDGEGHASAAPPRLAHGD